MSLLQRFFEPAAYYGRGARTIAAAELVEAVRVNALGLKLRPRDNFYAVFTPEMEQLFVQEFMLPKLSLKRNPGDGEDCDDLSGDDIPVGTRRAWRRMTGGTGKAKAIGWVDGGWRTGKLHRAAFSLTTGGWIWWSNEGKPYNPAFDYTVACDA